MSFVKKRWIAFGLSAVALVAVCGLGWFWLCDRSLRNAIGGDFVAVRFQMVPNGEFVTVQDAESANGVRDWLMEAKCERSFLSNHAPSVCALELKRDDGATITMKISRVTIPNGESASGVYIRWKNRVFWAENQPLTRLAVRAGKGPHPPTQSNGQ